MPPLPGEEPGVCPPGKQWQPCAHVPASCAELSAAPAAGGRCHPGCSCPPGALLLVRGDGEVGMGLVGTPPTPYPGATSYRTTSAWRRRNVPVPRTARSTCPGTPCPGAARTGQCPSGGGTRLLLPPTNLHPLSPAPASPAGSPTAPRWLVVMVRPPPAPDVSPARGVASGTAPTLPWWPSGDTSLLSPEAGGTWRGVPQNGGVCPK